MHGIIVPDALSSVGSFVGILGARLGCPIMDPIASVVICIFILKAAIEFFKDAIDRMVDHSCDEKTEDKMRQAVLEVPGVRGETFSDQALWIQNICGSGDLCRWAAEPE